MQKTQDPNPSNRDAPFSGRAHRVYFAITNNCNRACPWCSVYSKPGLQTYLSTERYEKLLPSSGLFEAQFEGGEPMLHPQLDDLVQRAWATGRCRRVVLCTNGVRIPKNPEALRAWILSFGAPFTLKVSLNHYLYARDTNHIARARLLADVVQSLQQEEHAVELVFNLRRRRQNDEDQWLQHEVKKAGLMPWTNDFFLQRYGLAGDDTSLEPPYLVGEDFTLINPDGTTWGTDLLARSEAMGKLP